MPHVAETKRLLVFKLAATVLVAAAMLYPLFTPDGRAGVMASIGALGWFWLGAILSTFLIAIFFYCRALQACLEKVSSQACSLNPRGVWLMFMPFYNIVEDFFIIHGVTRSLRAEAETNPRIAGLAPFGAASGFGWCAAQVLALVPTHLGAFASLVALVLWLWHWRFIAGVSRRLAQLR